MLSEEISDIITMDNVKVISGLTDEEMSQLWHLGKDFSSFIEVDEKVSESGLIAMFILGFALSKFTYTMDDLC